MFGLLRKTPKKTMLFFGWFFYPQTGGVETFMLREAKYFINRGYKVFVLSSKYGDSGDETISNIKVLRRKFVSTLDEYPIEKLKKEFAEILDEIKPDVIQFHNGSYSSAAEDMSIGINKIKVLFDVAKEKNILTLEHSHNAQLRQPEATKLLRDLPWDCVICVSQFVRDRWNLLGNKAKKLIVIYNGIKISDFKNRSQDRKLLLLKKNYVIILFPARILHIAGKGFDEQKRFKTVFEACSLLKREGINNFKLVGILNKPLGKDSSAIENLNDMAKNSDLEENLIFLEEIKPEKMASYYSASDIICVPSINETFGFVYLEGMASGKVVIASNTGGPKEYIKNNFNGFLIKPDDSKGLSEVLKQLINNKKLRDKIGKQAQKTAQKFTEEKTFKQIEKIYEDLWKKQ